jgi:hypothetical protein
MGGVGLLAALMPVGQDVEKGRWQTASKALPVALNMTPTETVLRFDRDEARREQHTLLVEVINAPRNGPGLLVAPAARMDDALLDVQVYEGLDQAALARRFLALKLGMSTDDSAVHRARAGRVDVQTAHALPVVADSKVVGVTPARFEILPGALLVIPGDGFGLDRPASAALVAACASQAAPLATAAVAEREPADDLPAPPAPGDVSHGPQAAVTSVLGAVAPVAAGGVNLTRQARRLSVPAAAVAGAVALPLLRLLVKRLHLQP